MDHPGSEQATLNWTTDIREGERRTLVVDKATGLYLDITFSRRAQSLNHDRAYRTGILGGDWCTVIEVDGQLTKIASPLRSEDAAKAHAEGWERDLP